MGRCANVPEGLMGALHRKILPPPTITAQPGPIEFASGRNQKNQGRAEDTVVALLPTAWRFARATGSVLARGASFVNLPSDRASVLTRRRQRLDEGDRGKTASFEVDIQHVVPVGLAHLKQLHPRIDAGVVDENVGRAKHLDRIGNHRIRYRPAAPCPRGPGGHGDPPGGCELQPIQPRAHHRASRPRRPPPPRPAPPQWRRRFPAGPR